VLHSPRGSLGGIAPQRSAASANLGYLMTKDIHEFVL
jgi:hypothetical protein